MTQRTEDVAGATGDSEPASGPDDGIESQLLVARMMRRLTGRAPAPVRIGRYRIEERLGRGGMGAVYAGWDELLSRPVAIKLLRRHGRDEPAGDALLQEARAAARLTHPNVMHVYEVGEHEGDVYMVMERLRGVTLREWCRAQPRDWRAIVDVFLEAGGALVAAHDAGLVHRDFKPDNVVIDTDGHAKVVDFGLARPVDDRLDALEGAPTSTAHDGLASTIAGTPAYMAPEVLAGHKPDARADQFAFCTALFEALYQSLPGAARTGKAGESSNVASERRPVARAGGPPPRALHEVVVRGLSPRPDDRWPAMVTLLAALRRSTRRAPASRWLVVVAAAAGLFAVVGYLSRNDAAPAPAPSTSSARQAAILETSNLPPVVAEPEPGDSTGVVLHRLDNGLSVYSARRVGEPVIDIRLAVRAGPIHETPEHAALSYCLPFALEMGTDTLGVVDAPREAGWRWIHHAALALRDLSPDPLWRSGLLALAAHSQIWGQDTLANEPLGTLAEDIGGECELQFEDSGVVFACQIPRNRFSGWIEVLGEMFQRPTFRRFPEASARCTEALRWFSDDSQGEWLGHELLGLTAGLGVEDYLTRPADASIHAFRGFYSRYYRPNNAALVIVGDIEQEELLPLVERSFRGWEPAAIPATQRPPAAPHGPPAVVHGGGPPRVFLHWPLPADAPGVLPQLPFVLTGPNGLLGARVAHEASFAMTVTPGWVRLNAAINGPRDAATVTDAILAGLRAIGDQGHDDALWRDALADAELASLAWARSSTDLGARVAISYLEGRSWAEERRLMAKTPSRDEVAAAIRWLLARPPGIVIQEPGPPWFTVTERSPLPRPVIPASRRSPRSLDLLRDSVTPLEPRFLIEGLHYNVQRRSPARVLWTRDDGPLFWLHAVWPVGFARDRWVCDAFRAHASSIDAPGVDVEVRCGDGSTGLEITGPTSQTGQVMALLPDILTASGSGVGDAYAVSEAEAAAAYQSHVSLDGPLAYLDLLRGEAGGPRRLPSFAELATFKGRELAAALRRTMALDPDILYVGSAPERLLDALPPPRGTERREPAPFAMRTNERPRVIVYDRPGRKLATVWVARPSPGTTSAEQLAGLAYDLAVVQAAEPTGRLNPLKPHRFVTQPIPGPMTHAVGFRVAPADVNDAIAAGLATLRVRPTRASLQAALAQLEIDLRTYRVPPRDMLAVVLRFGADGVDPRIALWSEFPRLTLETVETYAARLETGTPLIGVLADRTALDLDALAVHGEVIVVDVAALRRPQATTELDDLAIVSAG